MSKPRYEDRDPRGWHGDPSRGAALGRVSVRKPGAAGRLTLQRIRINSGGYDRLGTYWGIGAPLYWCASEDGRYETTFRAADREAAKAHVAADAWAPQPARFWR